MSFADPILGPTVVGMLGADGHLTPAARDAFVTQVALLMVSGNPEGKGAKISSLLGIAFPPVAGPKLFDPDKFLVTPNDPQGDLFWFAPSPTALLTIPVLSDTEKAYQKQFVNQIYEPLVQMMNLNGNLSIFPLFDPTVAFPSIKIPDIKAFLDALTLAIPNPVIELPKLATKFSIDVGDLLGFIPPLIPKIGALPLPPIPPMLPVPLIPAFDFIVFPRLVTGLLTIPIKIMTPSLALSLITTVPPDPPSLFLKILEIALDIVLKLLEDVGLLVILPKLMVSSITVLLQNMISMIVVDFIGTVLGAGGLCKLAASVLGLV